MGRFRMPTVWPHRMRLRHIGAAHDARAHGDVQRDVQQVRSRPDGLRYVQLLAEKCWRERSVLLLLSLGIGAFSLGELGMAVKFMVTRAPCAMHS